MRTSSETLWRTDVGEIGSTGRMLEVRNISKSVTIARVNTWVSIVKGFDMIKYEIRNLEPLLLAISWEWHKKTNIIHRPFFFQSLKYFNFLYVVIYETYNYMSHKLIKKYFCALNVWIYKIFPGYNTDWNSMLWIRKICKCNLKYLRFFIKWYRFRILRGNKKKLNSPHFFKMKSNGFSCINRYSSLFCKKYNTKKSRLS